ncbi:MAG: DUF6056 family protein [Algoriphagus sp.]|uniref:DUF6056 family protein n=1 Tax=Algoriphagus sp. TaxID=1872435 RepID=UPI0027348188|nr:DUF6056 family protein [Algoriphagus sp.]MDP3200378.1 DUF6056 family protein [Algoriphagus sp.]
MIQNKFTYVLFFLILIGSFLFLLTAVNGFYWMDDFWKRYEVVNTGFYSFAKSIYFGWDGRAISPLYTFRNFLLFLFDWNQAYIPIGLAILSQFALGFCLISILKELGFGPIDRFQTVFLTLLVTLILVLIFRPHLSRSLYWVTGSFYSYANTLLFFSILFMIRKPNSFWNLILAFTVVSTGPNSGLFFLTFWFGKQVLGLAPASKKVFFTGLGVGVVTLALIVFAPGNFVRSAGSLDFDLINASKGFIQILREYIGMSKWVVIGSVLLAFLLPAVSNKNNTVLILLLIIGSLSTLLPFVFLPGAASKHTSNFFQVGLFLSFVFLFTKFKEQVKMSVILLFKQTVLLFFLLYFIYQISIQLITGNLVYNEIEERYTYLEDHRGSPDIIYFQKVIIPDDNWVSRFWDIEANPDYYNNQYHQRYFGTGEIILVND